MHHVILLYNDYTNDNYSGDKAYIPRCHLLDAKSKDAQFCLSATMEQIEDKITDDWPELGTNLITFIRDGLFAKARIINVNARGPNERLRNQFASIPVDVMILDPDDGYHMRTEQFAIPCKEWDSIFGKTWDAKKHEKLWSQYLGGYPFDHEDEEKDTFLWKKYQFEDESLLVQTIKPDQVRNVKVIRFEFHPDPNKDEGYPDMSTDSE